MRDDYFQDANWIDEQLEDALSWAHANEDTDWWEDFDADEFDEE